MTENYLRITSGKWKNKKLKAPNEILPLRERVKLAVFSIIDEYILNSVCLDLFAGSGSLGFEALSRGARKCTFVDDNYYAIQSLKENAKNIEISLEENKTAIILKDSALKFVSDEPGYYDIIFLDPPYDLHINHLLKIIHEILNKNGLIIYFHSSKDTVDIKNLNSALKTIDPRKYGATAVDFISFK